MLTQKQTKVNEKIDDFIKHKNFALQIQKALAENNRNKITNKLTRKGENILNCGTSLEFQHYFDPNDTRTLHTANFCKNKLCPMCAWRYHIKNSVILQKTFEILGKQDYYHLVLTIPNTKFITKEFLVKLREKASIFMEKIAKSIDYLISFEITIDKNKYFHPHYHIIYINKLQQPLTRKKIQTEWAKIANTGTNYAIAKQTKCTNNNIALELTKYILKFEDIEPEQNILKIIDMATKSTKKICARGVILEAKKQAEKELDKEKFEIMQNLKIYDSEIEWFKWFNGTYHLEQRRCNTNE